MTPRVVSTRRSIRDFVLNVPARRPAAHHPRFDNLEGRALLTTVAPVARPVSGVVAPLDVVDGSSVSYVPTTYTSGMVVGAGGNVWAGQSDPAGKAQFAVYSPEGKLTATYPIPGATSAPFSPVLGPDGNVWFAAYVETTTKIGAITPDGRVQLFDLPPGTADFGDGNGPSPVQPSISGLAVGPDGAIWYTDSWLQGFGRITTDGQTSTVAIPSTQPFMLTSGGGALWYVATDASGNFALNRYHPTTGAKDAVPLPQASSPSALTTAPDGTIWFLDNANNTVNHVTAAGKLVSLPIRAEPGYGSALAVDAAGNAWIAGSQSSLTVVAPNGFTSTVPVGGDSSYVANLVATPTGFAYYDNGAGAFGSVSVSALNASPASHPLTGDAYLDYNAFVVGKLQINGQVAKFFDGNPNGDASDFTATIDWGDGRTSAGVIKALPTGGFAVTGDHTYDAEAEYTLKITITDVNPAHPSGNALKLTSYPVTVTPNPIIPIMYNMKGGFGGGGGPVPIAIADGTAKPAPVSKPKPVAAKHPAGLLQLVNYYKAAQLKKVATLPSTTNLRVAIPKKPAAVGLVHKTPTRHVIAKPARLHAVVPHQFAGRTLSIKKHR